MGKAGTAKADKMVHGILAEKLSEAAVDAGLKELDMHPATGMPLEDRVELLVEHFATLASNDLADCNTCKGASAAALSACPFCGDGGMNGPQAVPEGEAASDSLVQEGQEMGEYETHGEDDGEIPVEVETPEHEVNAVEMEATPPAAPAPQELVDKKAAKAAKDVEKAEKDAAKAAVKLAAREAKKAAKANPLPFQDATGAAATAIVPRTNPAELASLALLDRKVAEIKSLETKGRAYLYDVATAFQDLHKSELWKLRRDVGGRVAYSTFEQFVQQEVGYTPQFVVKLIRTATHFSRDEFLAFGPNKLAYVIQAPEPERAEVLDRLKEGASKRELQAEVAERREKAGLSNSRGQSAEDQKAAKAKKAAQKKPEPKRDANSVTAVVVVGKTKRVALFKPQKGDEAKAPAKQVEGAWGYLDLANDVRVFFVLHKAEDGSLYAKTEIRRVEE